MSGTKSRTDAPGKYYFEQDGKFYKASVGKIADNYGEYSIHYNIYELYVFVEPESKFSHYSKGEFIEEVKSKNKNEYPINGDKSGYWYEFIK